MLRGDPRAHARMAEKPQVVTVKQAFHASLGKWRRVQQYKTDLFNEWDRSCGFCDYVRSLSDSGNKKDCELCPVKARCDSLQEAETELENLIDEQIDKTISFLEKQVIADDD